jgi:predicted transcriptional regulator
MLDVWAIEFIKQNQITQRELSKIWHISEAAVSYKINGLTRIHIQEITALIRHYPAFTDFLIQKLTQLKNNQPINTPNSNKSQLSMPADKKIKL